MRTQKDLSGTWEVVRTEGGHGPQSPEAFALQRPRDPVRALSVPVPMELHRALEGPGLIEDPHLGLNSLKARWVSEQYWPYTRSFDALLNKRHWLRKPQYQFIWDWNPRLINVGITGPVYLEWTGECHLHFACVCVGSDRRSHRRIHIPGQLLRHTSRNTLCDSVERGPD